MGSHDSLPYILGRVRTAACDTNIDWLCYLGRAPAPQQQLDNSVLLMYTWLLVRHEAALIQHSAPWRVRCH